MVKEENTSEEKSEILSTAQTTKMFLDLLRFSCYNAVEMENNPTLGGSYVLSGMRAQE